MSELLAATVTSTAPFQVTLDGASTAMNAKRLAAYTPALSDRVVVARYGSRVLVLGKEA